MDTQANTLISPHEKDIQTTNTLFNRMIPDDPCLKSNQHLTIVKYLPINAFKSPLSLNQHLNSIYSEVKHLDRGNKNGMITQLASTISTAVTDLQTDYKSKLDLIDTAYHHRLFDNKNLFLKLISFVARIMRKGNKRFLFESDTQTVLINSIFSPQFKRDSIILC